MRPLKIAWDTTYTRRNLTGSGVYAARLMEQLAARSDLHVAEMYAAAQNFDSRSLLRRAFQTAGNLAWTHVGLPRLLSKGGFDVLHSPAFVAPIAPSCPSVITVHDLSFLHYPSHFAGWWVKYLNLVLPRTTRSASAVVCGSESSKQDIVNTYSIPACKVHVVPYGVDLQRFNPNAKLDHQWAQSIGINKEYLLHVGVFSERKNIPLLLRAVSRLRDSGRFNGYQLVLAGKEAPGIVGARSIEETIRSLELHDIVVMAGHVPDEQIAGLYAGAKLLAMPSLHEGFGFPVLEAMATGTPVVASDTSSLPEIAGDAAILVPPSDERALADAIQEILASPVLQEELRAKGQLRAQQYTWKRTADETAAVYQAVARG